jgi:hypothetical protein
VFEDCTGCTLTGNHVQGVDSQPAALVLKDCRYMNLNGGTILDYGACGVLLENVSHSRISNMLVRDDRQDASGKPFRLAGGRGNFLTGNLLDREPELDAEAATATNNVLEAK